MLQACVLVPFPVIPEKNEFASGRISWLRSGSTTRTEVVEQLGEPIVVRNDGNLAIYGQARTVAGLFFGALWGSGGTMPVEKKSVLLIGYENTGVVSQVYVMDGKSSCTESGLCVEAKFELEETGKLMELESNLVAAVIYDSGNGGRPERRFGRSIQSCGVYLYSSGADDFLAIESPEIGTTSIVIRGYIYWVSEPGTLSVKASRQVEWGSLSFECPANELRFVNIYASHHTRSDPPRITIENEETGKAQVLSRSSIYH